MFPLFLSKTEWFPHISTIIKSNVFSPGFYAVSYDLTHCLLSTCVHAMGSLCVQLWVYTYWIQEKNFILVNALASLISQWELDEQSGTESGERDQ